MIIYNCKRQRYLQKKKEKERKKKMEYLKNNKIKNEVIEELKAQLN